MQFMFQYPDVHGLDADMLDAGPVTDVAIAAERAGWSGISFTEHRVADVINSSWGFEDPTGSSFEAMTIDALALANHTTVVISAGNSGPGANTVGGPASGYNKIAVGALAADNSNFPYLRPAEFSSRGPNDFYNPQTGVTKAINTTTQRLRRWPQRSRFSKKCVIRPLPPDSAGAAIQSIPEPMGKFHGLLAKAR